MVQVLKLKIIISIPICILNAGLYLENLWFLSITIKNKIVKPNSYTVELETHS